jgi:5-bromo-4-chloroindolyl phosphate hydrolysis protein
MLNDNYCPWPNKDDFCKAWLASQEWQRTFRERLHETLQRALTWEKRVKEKDFGTVKGMKKTMRIMRQFEKTELFLKEVNSYIASAREARALDSIGCVSCQGKRKI